MICTTYQNANQSGTACGSAESDKHGQFEIHVPLGEVGVFAEKQQGGYWSVVDLSPPPQRKGIHMLKLTREEPTARVTLKIGPRPGLLKFDVKDKSTGKPVTGFGVRWIGVDNTRMMSVEISPQTQAFIPPAVDVIVEVHAKGYRRWFYLDPSTSQPILRLSSGEEKQLDVELEPTEAK
jgi:hypothetical protein